MPPLAPALIFPVCTTTFNVFRLKRALPQCHSPFYRWPCFFWQQISEVIIMLTVSPSFTFLLSWTNSNQLLVPLLNWAEGFLWKLKAFIDIYQPSGQVFSSLLTQPVGWLQHSSCSPSHVSFTRFQNAAVSHSLSCILGRFFSVSFALLTLVFVTPQARSYIFSPATFAS